MLFLRQRCWVQLPIASKVEEVPEIVEGTLTKAYMFEPRYLNEFVNKISIFHLDPLKRS